MVGSDYSATKCFDSVYTTEQQLANDSNRWFLTRAMAGKESKRSLRASSTICNRTTARALPSIPSEPTQTKSKCKDHIPKPEGCGMCNIIPSVVGLQIAQGSVHLIDYCTLYESIKDMVQTKLTL